MAVNPVNPCKERLTPMAKHKPKSRFAVGNVLNIDIRPEHISDSDPCNKDNCMLSRALPDYLVATYGGSARDYKVKSTNHGTTFELNGRKYLAVFDSKTANRIYKYDQIYRETRSKEKARSGVRPFTTRLMIESSVVATKWPPMSEETKAKLRSLPRKKRAATSYVPRATGSRRELSL